MVEWINAKQWEPEQAHDVLVLIYEKETGNLHMVVGNLNLEYNWQIFTGDSYKDIGEGYEVTHWTLLPRMPALI